nr:cyclopropane-fatty-acyl-phospholipid synthase [Raoultella sp. NCTC 9187]
MEDWHNIGADYDTTLMAWYERFLASWPDIADNYTSVSSACLAII